MTDTPLVPTSAFHGLENVTHLATGGESPWLRAHDDVYASFARRKSAGFDGRAEIYAEGEACRAKMARLWGVAPERIGFMPSASESMSWLARGIEWRAGDNVVTDDMEFPSVGYAWRPLERLGVEVRAVAHRDHRVHEADLEAAMDARTRVLAVSQVSYYSGQCIDVARLSRAAHEQGALLALDATHASGVVQVDAGLADLCTSSAYKWLLATHGVAPCYVSEPAESAVRATSVGWHNVDTDPQTGATLGPFALRAMPALLEPGNPSMVSVLFLGRALDVIAEVGIERIEAHARDLSERLHAGLDTLGANVITPRERAARSGNTCFLAGDAERVRDALAREGVYVWGEKGRVRVSTHLYNTGGDVDRLIELLAHVR